MGGHAGQGSAHGSANGSDGSGAPREATQPPQHGTVGAVCIDCHGAVACATSSGGLWLKPPGRVGIAGLPGLGSHASSRNGVSAACVMSGCGEETLASAIPTRCVDGAISGAQRGATASEAMLEAMAPIAGLRPERGAGIVMVRGHTDGTGFEVGWAHNTAEMALGCLSSHNRFRSTISRAVPEGSTTSGGWGCGGPTSSVSGASAGNSSDARST